MDKQRVEEKAKDGKWILMTLVTRYKDDEEEHRWLWWRGNERNRRRLSEMKGRGGRRWRGRVKSRLADESIQIKYRWCHVGVCQNQYKWHTHSYSSFNSFHTVTSNKVLLGKKYNPHHEFVLLRSVHIFYAWQSLVSCKVSQVASWLMTTTKLFTIKAKSKGGYKLFL